MAAQAESAPRTLRRLRELPRFGFSCAQTHPRSHLQRRRNSLSRGAAVGQSENSYPVPFLALPACSRACCMGAWKRPSRPTRPRGRWLLNFFAAAIGLPWVGTADNRSVVALARRPPRDRGEARREPLPRGGGCWTSQTKRRARPPRSKNHTKTRLIKGPRKRDEKP